MTTKRHNSINIALIQARESMMAFFRPIFNQHNITEQQWRIVRLLAENGRWYVASPYQAFLGRKLQRV